ncbi:hypothetical protein C3K47_08300 [Solitalea longa]|uniref:Uncharacterized protein n=1 Tax=Solitalea longa TaxID=2079460 RepID=A0A2S5A416_9SPHI|nr:hypothetical protein [Solitalea longa]POY37049.1 hypothetical protein C3K47_08300 [Solitalea longa]
MVKKYWVVLIALMVGCQPGKKEAQQSADSLASLKETDSAVSETPYAKEINAQDTLFNDGSIPTSWSTAGFSDPVKFKLFVVSFKDWVKNDQTDSIAAHIKFPLGKIKTAEEFKNNYPKLFDEPLKRAIEDQHLNQIFRNQQGAMMGSGAIWFIESNGNYYISAINN